MRQDLATVDLILKLLEETTSLEVVGHFLRQRGLASSASGWRFLRDNRILPALEQNKITVNDLISLLRDAEEHGRQHVFLYRVDRNHVGALLARNRVQAALRRHGLTRLLETPRILDQPDEPTVSDVRWETANIDLSLIVKVIEKRRYRKLISQREEGNRLFVEYEFYDERAVNVARLHHDGILELRIGTHTNSSKYDSDIERFRQIVAPIIPLDGFREWSVQKAKNNLWTKRAESRTSVRWSDSRLRNDNGTVITAATRDMEASLDDDEGAASSVDAFMEHADSRCEASNIYFIKGPPEGTPSKDIHVILAGQLNEFALTANCNERDYNYVFNEIKRHNR